MTQHHVHNKLSEDSLLSKIYNEIKPEDRPRLVQFLSQGSEKGDTDAWANIVVMENNVHAWLHVTPSLKVLPIIERTGLSSPYMLGRGLELEGNIVTDTTLQRTGSLFLSTRAAQQECAALYQHMLETLCLLPDFSEKIKKSESNPLFKNIKNKEVVFTLIDCLETWHKSKINNPGQCPNDWIEKTKEFVNHPVLAKFLKYENNIFQKRLGDPKKIYEDIREKKLSFRNDKENDELLLVNLFKAFFLALDEDNFNSRHFNLTGRQYHNSSMKNLVIQGAGDLSMNQWNVTLYREDKNDEPEIFLPQYERYSERLYHCLVYWKKGTDKNHADDITKSNIGVSL